MATARKTSRKPKAKSPAQRMAAYRARMRAQGLKPVVLWLPDRNDPKFIAACRRQVAALAKSDPAGDEALAFIEATYEWPAD